jgi:hypothetical protein
MKILKNEPNTSKEPIFDFLQKQLRIRFIFLEIIFQIEILYQVQLFWLMKSWKND